MEAATYAISLESVLQAAQRIDGAAHRTPVVTSQTLDALATQMQGRPVRLFFKVSYCQLAVITRRA